MSVAKWRRLDLWQTNRKVKPDTLMRFRYAKNARNGMEFDEYNALRRVLKGDGISYYGIGHLSEDKVNITDIKPLQPLTHGNILIVGGKPSNFDEELRTHPRVIMWDSQHEHWTDKDLPQNTRAVFITRFIGHAAFGKILSEARKKQITIFNPTGTGMIIRQVRELLDIDKVKAPIQVHVSEPTIQKVETVPQADTKVQKPGGAKLHVFLPYIDFDKGNTENAKILLPKAKELGVQTTFGSLAQFVSTQRAKKSGRKTIRVSTRPERPVRIHKHVDVAVEMLDNMVKELQDMRDYLVATTEENKSLKLKLEKFRQFLKEVE
jgi:hypothetical protein